jgi:hypothetical protein
MINYEYIPKSEVRMISKMLLHFYPDSSLMVSNDTIEIWLENPETRRLKIKKMTTVQAADLVLTKVEKLRKRLKKILKDPKSRPLKTPKHKKIVPEIRDGVKV